MQPQYIETDMHYNDLVAFCNQPVLPKHGSSATRPWILSIDGNIGAGKTTLLSMLEQDVNPRRVVILREPVDKWTQMVDPSDGVNLLQKFYEHPLVYSFMFQVVVMSTTMQSIDEAIAANPECEIIVCERSIATSRKVFANMLYQTQKMSLFEYQTYESMFTPMVCERYYPDKMVYLDVPVHICYERMKKRAREGEETVTMEYLTQLDRVYREFCCSETCL
jgi:deoxyadenosine/deoxycytidine kinase